MNIEEKEEIGRQRRRVAGFMAVLTVFVALFIAASYLVSVVLTNHFSELSEGEKMIPVSGGAALRTVVIDPGHGGEDGGSSCGEVLEKDLNLAEAKDVRDILRLMGVPVSMTREEDKAVYDLYGDLDDYSGKKKIYDLKNRVRFATEAGGIYLGIHMNKFPEERYRGLQVYYSGNDEESERLASAIQKDAAERLQPWNKRETKRATSAIFVLDRLRVPAVLVECGFLSNPEDLSELTDPAYRARLAAVISYSVAKYETERSGY